MPHYLSLFYYLLLIFYITSFNPVLSGRFTTEDPASWTGIWFPEKPSSLTKQEKVKSETKSRPMGEKNPDCDDGKTNLSIDWNGALQDYICLNPRNRFFPNASIHSKIEYENIPKLYMAPHFCMQMSIEYKSKLPTFGPHRPLWPKYGEYKYVPKQRWLHTLEHGGIVALYHPCADLSEIKLLKKVVKGCLRRHVITPTSDLTPERPFALVAWGVRFTMPTVNVMDVQRFIKEHALQGPEKLADEGQYEFLLLKEAKIISDFNDSRLCP
ncbi:UNVERIFIED_CONTAM: hypothetical protein PYX00_010423 [Menopon gallinae]|uniref:Uncharacterized protein n=1 Tax=Menopon gallinae TaxID=328185 RepID=A0AAW2HFF3_9NEOP